MDQEQEQPYIPQSGGHAGNMIVMTNPDREIKKMEANLRGQSVDRYGRASKRENVKPLMNESGINMMVGLVRSVLSRNTNMANLNDRVLNGIMEGIAETFITVLMMNRVEFGIKNDSDRSAIFNECANRCHIAITRGWNADDKRFWKGTVHEVNYGISGPAQQMNAGFMSQLNPKNWGGK